MRITLKPVQHDAVKVTSPRGTELDPADMLRHIRRVEAEERAKAWARAKYAQERANRRGNHD